MPSEAVTATIPECEFCGDPTSPAAWTTCEKCGHVFCGVECYEDHLKHDDFPGCKENRL
jgi:hypothetical protein